CQVSGCSSTRGTAPHQGRGFTLFGDLCGSSGQKVSRMTGIVTSWCGQSVERVEDGPLLTGRGRFIDDLPIGPGTLHAAILRSSHAHARIRRIDTAAARAAPGVAAVITAADVTAVSASLVAGVKAPIECGALQ